MTNNAPSEAKNSEVSSKLSFGYKPGLFSCSTWFASRDKSGSEELNAVPESARWSGYTEEYSSTAYESRLDPRSQIADSKMHVETRFGENCLSDLQSLEKKRLKVLSRRMPYGSGAALQGPFSSRADQPARTAYNKYALTSQAPRVGFASDLIEHADVRVDVNFPDFVLPEFSVVPLSANRLSDADKHNTSISEKASKGCIQVDSAVSSFNVIDDQGDKEGSATAADDSSEQSERNLKPMAALQSAFQQEPPESNRLSTLKPLNEDILDAWLVNEEAESRTEDSRASSPRKTRFFGRRWFKRKS